MKLLLAAISLLMLSLYANAESVISAKDKKLIEVYKAPSYLVMKNKEVMSYQRSLFHKNLLKKLKMEAGQKYAGNMKNAWKKIDIKDELELRNKILDKMVEPKEH